jgi:hypothetical protein
MDVLSLLQAGFNGAKRDQENHRRSKRKKKTQKQARTRSVAGVLYSALVYNCWCCCSGQLQILLLQLLLLLLVLVPPSLPAAVATNKESREEKHSLWRHARELGGMQQMQTESAKVVSIFSSFAILFFVTQKFIIIFFCFFSKMGLHKNSKVSVFPF